MQTSTIDKVKQFKGKKILVVGDIMIDNYVHGDVNRICPEAPVPIMDVEYSYQLLGGAGNVATYLSELGAEVSLYGQVGRDQDKGTLKSQCAFNKIKFIGHFIGDGYRTTTKNRALGENNQIVFRWDDEEIRPLENFSKEKLEKALSESDAVIISDYGKGVVTHEIAEFIIQRHSKVIVDPKFVPWSHFDGAYIIKPNKKEYESIGNPSVLHYEAATLNTNLIVTLGKNGMNLGRKGSNFTEHVPTDPVDVIDVTGAGDMVSAVLALSAAVDMNLIGSMRLANIASGIKISQHGTGHISLEKLLESLVEQNIEDSIFDLDILGHQFVFARLVEDKKVVFTNGCFDLLHDGHIELLKKAKALGDMLVIGLNSDESIKRLKGDNRPIQSEKVRAQVMASIKYVDAVVIFDDDTPLELIKTISPDVLVKGSDYRMDEVVGYDVVTDRGGEVVLVDLVEGSSTSNIVDKIKSE